MRGEDPAAIRIVDLALPRRREVADNNIDYIPTDVSNYEAVLDAFEKPWPSQVQKLSLTVFHCVAYLSTFDRLPDMLPTYVKVNINGTENVLSAARAVGASCFISTSSSSIGIKPPSYLPWPWQRRGKNTWQLIPNAEPLALDQPLQDFAACYVWSKAQAEIMVCKASNPEADFVTGVIRPGHAIYGHGGKSNPPRLWRSPLTQTVENSSSLTWDYCRRGGAPSWLHNVVANFVNAQNVSIGHLAYEDAITNRKHPGGKGYCVTDPNPPITYGSLYNCLVTLAHPLTPMSFPSVSHIAMLPIAYAVEAYLLVRRRYLPSLPAITSDLIHIQPATFNLCTLHIVYTDTAAQEEIGYRAPIKTLEGFALAMVDWNARVEKKAKLNVKQGKGEQIQVPNGLTIPKPANVH